MKRSFKMVLPLYVHTTKSRTKKGKFILNLNNYRRVHFFTLNKAKAEFKRLLKFPDKKFSTVSLAFVYFHGNKQKVDVANPCSIIDKFFCDALVDAGVIEDDNQDIVKIVSYIGGGVDKDYPRCEVLVKEL